MHTERLESLETRRSIWVMASKAAIASRAGEFFGAEFSRSKWNKYLWIVSLKSVCVYIFKNVALAYELAPRMTVVWLWFRNGRVPRIVFIVFYFSITLNIVRFGSISFRIRIGAHERYYYRHRRVYSWRERQKKSRLCLCVRLERRA